MLVVLAILVVLVVIPLLGIIGTQTKLCFSSPFSSLSKYELVDQLVTLTASVTLSHCGDQLVTLTASAKDVFPWQVCQVIQSVFPS